MSNSSLIHMVIGDELVMDVNFQLNQTKKCNQSKKVQIISIRFLYALHIGECKYNNNKINKQRLPQVDKFFNLFCEENKKYYEFKLKNTMIVVVNYIKICVSYFNYVIPNSRQKSIVTKVKRKQNIFSNVLKGFVTKYQKTKVFCSQMVGGVRDGASSSPSHVVCCYCQTLRYLPFVECRDPLLQKYYSDIKIAFPCHRLVLEDINCSKNQSTGCLHKANYL